jgi:hypothetical protein
VYDYSQVIFTTLWGAIFFAEFPDKMSLIGYVIIIGAAVVKYLYGRKPKNGELNGVKLDTKSEEKSETRSEITSSEIQPKIEPKIDKIETGGENGT